MSQTGGAGTPDRVNRRIALGLFVAAVVVRLVYAWFRDLGDPIPVGTDSVSYDVFARAIAAGFGWITHPDPSCYRPPIYPMILAFFYKLSGGHPQVVQIFQSLVGAATVLLLYDFGCRWANPRVGLLAALWLLFNPLHLDFNGRILREVWMVLLNLVLVMSLVARDGRSPGGIMRTALTFTLLAHLDSRYLFHLPFFAGYYALAAARPGPGGGVKRWFDIPGALKPLLLFLGLTVALSTPWAIRNAVAYDHFVLIDPRALERWSGRARTAVTGDHLSRADVLKQFEAKKAAGLDSVTAEERDAFRAGVRPRFGQPHKAYFNFLEFWRMFKIRAEYRPFPDARFASTWSKSHNMASLAFMGLLLPFFLFGAWRALAHPDPPALVMLAFIAVHTLLHVVVHSVTRYRLPVEPFYALIALRCAVDLLGPERRALPPGAIVPGALRGAGA